ncbi:MULTISPECIES: hypothetical protein [unclassified Nocardiopsis]|uniref:phage scaffolding protein n=1 Tax=unclassified Nocardiopsis TaxID=2649073 RepID=UPI00135A0E45|nr:MULTISPECIES: hypothetical protein [unclassified Nocardiopsis]
MSEAVPEGTAPATDEGQEVNDTATDAPEFSRSYVEKLRRENAKYRSQVRELEPAAAKVAELEAANATELERAVATAKAETEKAVSERYARLLVEAEARGIAAELRFRDPADAVRLVDLDDIEADKDGAVNRDAVRDALRSIAEAKPYLTEESAVASAEEAGIGVTGTGPGKDYASYSVTDLDKELGFT